MMNSIYSFLRRVRSGIHQDPTRDWMTLLTIAVIAFACIIVWNAWAFNTVASGGVIGTPPTTTPSLFSRTSLDAINTIFTSRSAEQQKYITGAYHYSDPSQ